MQTPTRPAIISGILTVFALALVVKAAVVQIAEHEAWSRMAVGQQVAEASLPAPRGDIEDATGALLAHSRELVRLSFSLDIISDRRALYQALLKARVPASRAKPVLDRQRKWYDLRQNFEPSQVAAIRMLKGVRSAPAGDRVAVQSAGAREILGRTNAEGKGVDGIELLLDSLLQGEPGRARTLKGRDGRRFETPDMLTEPPRPGHAVRLTINQVLQDICDEALHDATKRLDADGGDIVILDPHSGEIRCLTSHRRHISVLSAATIVEPFEPGSTLKPFLVGRLIEAGKATPGEMIETFDGAYTVFGRRINDIHKASRMSVADVIRYSSNVGIARLSERVSDADLFMLYRDLGFGTPTGVSYPIEAAGVLYHPRTWSKQSHHSLAIGYEVSVTPLQLALAYGSLANGGVLMAPGLIKEIRDADGRVKYRHRPREVRRVFDEGTTRTVMAMLASVVDSGTATDAELATFDLAGKSGTARRTVAGRYGTQGTARYTSSFVGLFPSKHPQYVVLVKLDNPRGTYFGGKTAAPVAKAVITAALAARDASLDWGNLPTQRASYQPPALGAAADVPNTDAAAHAVAVGSVALTSSAADSPPPVSRVPLVDSTPPPQLQPPVRFDLSKPLKEAPRVTRMIAVPDVRGLPLRVAVRELHRAGFRVQMVSRVGGGTTPPAGEPVRTGSIVRLSRP